MADEGRSPLRDYRVLREELRMYKDGVLMNKPHVLAINKSDRPYTRFNERFAALQVSTVIFFSYTNAIFRN